MLTPLCGWKLDMMVLPCGWEHCKMVLLFDSVLYMMVPLFGVVPHKMAPLLRCVPCITFPRLFEREPYKMVPLCDESRKIFLSYIRAQYIQVTNSNIPHLVCKLYFVDALRDAPYKWIPFLQESYVNVLWSLKVTCTEDLPFDFELCVMALLCGCTVYKMVLSFEVGGRAPDMLVTLT